MSPKIDACGSHLPPTFNRRGPEAGVTQKEHAKDPYSRSLPERCGGKHQSHGRALRAPHRGDPVFAPTPAPGRRDKHRRPRPPGPASSLPPRLPQPRPRPCSSLPALLAQRRGRQGSAQAPPPLQAQRGRSLPPRRGSPPLARAVRPQARRAPGRPGARGEGAAAALAKGCLSFLRPVQRRRAALSAARSSHGCPTRPSGAARGADAVVGVPSFPLHPGGPPAASRPRRLPAAILCAAAATHTIVGQDLRGKAQDPRATGSRPPNPESPQGSGPTYAEPTTSRIPFAPHTVYH